MRRLGACTCRADHIEPPGVERLQRELPLLGFHSQEVIAFPRLEERHAFGHLGVADDRSAAPAPIHAGRRRKRGRARRCRCRRRVERPSRRLRTWGPTARSSSTPLEGPSACMLLTSTMPIRLSSFQGAGPTLPPSQTAPSSQFAVREQAVDETSSTPCASGQGPYRWRSSAPDPTTRR